MNDRAHFNASVLEAINKNKKFIFVHFDIGVRIQGAHHGVASLVPIIKRHGFNISLIHMRYPEVVDDFTKKVLKEGPAIIGFTSNTNQFTFLQKYSNALARDLAVLQIAGGVHPTLEPEETLRKTALHGVCIGEGEFPLDELLTRISLKKDIITTPGFFWRDGKAIIKNRIPEPISDLSTLEFPDYSVFDRCSVINTEIERRLIVGKTNIKNRFAVMISRGCPYDCKYCCNAALKGATHSRYYYKLPPVEYAIRMLQQLQQKYPENQSFGFDDDLLLVKESWFVSFASQYKEEIGLPYVLHGRAECITPVIVSALKESGCLCVQIGIESGDEAYRNEFLGRSPTNDFILEKCQLIKDAGIELTTLNMIGLPFETEAQMRATYEFNRSIAPDSGTCFFFRPYPKTSLYEFCRTHDLLKSEEEILAVPSNYAGPLIRMSRETTMTCLRMHFKISIYFFTRILRFRCRKFLSDHRGIQKVYIFPYFILLIVTALKVFCMDNLRERFKMFRIQYK
ncbi:MAG: radical SAM protein [Candidatus Omnitrophica bacterium]|nr:radical SAM protein [Candidatus Omnitrophota bacterium]